MSSFYNATASPSPSSFALTPSQLVALALCLLPLLLNYLGFPLSAALHHPIATLAGVYELAAFKLSALVGKVGFLPGLSEVDWERLGEGLRGEDDALPEGEKGVRQVRSYRELVAGDGGESPAQYYPGLLNAAGNLCFLNATLQSMASTSYLLLYLQRIASLASTASPPLSTPVTSTLLLTLTALNTPSASSPPPLRPIELANALARSSTLRMQLLSSSEQQDAHELWGMIREAVQEELERVEKELECQREGGLADILGIAGAMSRDIMGAGGGRRKRAVKDPFLHLVSQRVKCMSCGYTRDVRHTGEEQVSLAVPPVTGCTLFDLLEEYTKMELISDYACRRCSLLATHDKLLAQRDRLALAPPPPAAIPSLSSSYKPSLIPASAASTPGEPPPAPASPFVIPPPPVQPVMTQSRKDRRRKVQKLVDRVKAALDAGDFERELGDEVKVERVEGPAGKQVRFARTPDILTLHLNRSTHFGRGGAYKNTCRVVFPELLDISPYTDSATSAPLPTPSPSPALSSPATPIGGPRTFPRDLYRLSSLVVHYGTHSSGHYVAFRRRPAPPSANGAPSTLSLADLTRALALSSPEADELHASVAALAPGHVLPEWYRVSDETVEPAGLAEALRANPFLVFYEKVRVAGHAGREEEGAGGGGGGESVGGGGSWRGVVPRLVESWRLGSRVVQAHGEVKVLEEEEEEEAQQGCDDLVVQVTT